MLVQGRKVEQIGPVLRGQAIENQKEILKSILKETWSQWSEAKTGEIYLLQETKILSSEGHEQLSCDPLIHTHL